MAKSDTNKLFAEYAAIVLQEEQLAAKKEALREKIEKVLPDDGVENDYGTFSWMSRKKWTYSPAIVEADAVLKKQKKVEELTGIATFEESKTLLIKIAK